MNTNESNLPTAFTKREQIALECLKSMLASDGTYHGKENLVKSAFRFAEIFIQESEIGN